MALYTFNDNFQINAPKHIDTRYLNLFTPWANVAAANAGTPPAYRYLGLTLLINTTEYWYQAGVADINLVPKLGAAASITADNLLTLTGANLQLGGTILHDTLLDLTGQNFKIYINATSNTVSPFIVSNSGLAPSFLAQSTGAGGMAIQGIAGTSGISIQGVATNGVALYGSATNGIAGYFQSTSVGGAAVSIVGTGAQPLVVTSNNLPSFYQLTTVSNSAVVPIIQLTRQSSTGGAPTIGIGSSIEWYNRMSNGSSNISNSIQSLLTNVTTGSIDSQMVITGVNASAIVNKLIIGAPATQVISTRFSMAQGAAVAAANNLTLGVDGNLFSVTGSTQINAITIANWQAGSEIAFIFTGTPLLKNATAGGGGTAQLSLAGGVDYLAAVGDYIGFAYNGTVWKETTRRPAAGGSAGVFTANNGLSLSSSTNVQWGGTLIQTTGISAGNFFISFTGTGTSQLVAMSLSGASTTTTTTLSIANNKTGSGFSGQNYGLVVNSSGGDLSNVGIKATSTGGFVSGYGVWGVGDQSGIFGQGNIGVIGNPTVGSGQAGVKGDGGSNTVKGVWGVGNPGVFGEGSLGTGGGGGFFQADASFGGLPLGAFNIDTTNNNIVEVVQIGRVNAPVPAIGLGVALDVYLQTDTLVGNIVTRNTTEWVNATNGSESVKWALWGVTNGPGTMTRWIDVVGQGATFYGTGTAIIALNGSTGAFISGTNAGGVFESSNIPLQAANTSTSTNTVQTTYLSSRQGSSYLGAIGNGTQFSFDAKDSSGSVNSSGLFRNYLTVVTGSISSQFDFRLVNAGTLTTVLTLAPNGKIIANNVVNWIVAANNAAAITAGGVTGEFYRNGDIVQVVH